MVWLCDGLIVSVELIGPCLAEAKRSDNRPKHIFSRERAAGLARIDFLPRRCSNEGAKRESVLTASVARDPSLAIAAPKRRCPCRAKRARTDQQQARRSRTKRILLTRLAVEALHPSVSLVRVGCRVLCLCSRSAGVENPVVEGGAALATALAALAVAHSTARARSAHGLGLLDEHRGSWSRRCAVV